jgi:Protein of unknown function (DUF3987)
MTRLTSDPLDVVRDALLTMGCDPKGGQRITAKCPAHEDSNPSLSVARGTEQAVVFKCHAGCDPDNILAALRLEWSDLMEDDDAYERPVTKRIAAVYRYTDEHDVPLFEVVRYDPKDFRQRTPDGRWGLNGARRVPYRLSAVLAAVAAGRVVYVTEGEKDTHAVEQAGAVATTNPGGAEKWRPEYNPFFAGATVVIVGDDDPAGHRHVLDVHRHLKPVAASVRIVLPVPGAKDVAQHLGLGHGLDDLRPYDATKPPPTGEEWEPPVPLGYQGKAPIFPAHRLPPWLNDYVVAVAVALQVPVDLAALLVLAVLATAAGGRAVVEIKPGWREPLNLFVAVAMPPGTRKTPVFMRMIAPLVEHERAAVDAARPDVNETKARKAVAAAEANQALQEAERASGDAQEEAIHFAAAKAQMAEAITIPVLPRLLADDATPEALTSLLAEQGGRLGLFSDEGEVFNMMAGRYSSAGPNLAVYLKGHVGSPIRVDRKGRDAEYIEAPALTLGLTVQPEVLESVMAIEGARGRGLLGRFLWSVPPSNIGQRDADPAAIPADLEARYVDEMKVLVGSLAEWTDPVPIPFTTEASMALIAYQRNLEPHLGEYGELGHIADWAAKLVGHVARIAGLLHLATNVRTGWASPVERETVDDAIHIGHYLVDHALIAFDHMQSSGLRLRAQAILVWLDSRAIETFSRRQVHNALQHKFADVEELKETLDLLEGNGFIRQMPEVETTARRGRKRSPQYQVNPQLSKFAGKHT